MSAVLKQSTWDLMTPQQRVSAVNIDIMNHPEFCVLSGMVMVGKVSIVDDAQCPTAGTNGVDVVYGENFLLSLTRKQLRFVQLHETLHKALRHCVDYKDINRKYPRLSNIAQDYVVNAFIAQTDPNNAFMDFTDEPKPLLDTKYYDRSFVDVLQDLLRQGKGGGGEGRPTDGHGEGPPTDGHGQPLDQHGELPEGTDEEAIRKEIEDALNHGDMVQKRMAGTNGKGSRLSGLGVKRDTDWRNALREWVQEACRGDEYSRFVPPNRKFLPLGVIMPSHFDIATGELGILCDTSGSMYGIYPVVFGEIANICQQANPERVRLIWWDNAVRGEQVFERGQYDTIAQQIKPVGGGGTTPACVVDYIEQKQYNLSGAIWLTDGYLDSAPRAVCGNELWGVVDNDHFKPAHGKVLRIHSGASV
jgi:predicted metal-dependent peptidase